MSTAIKEVENPAIVGNPTTISDATFAQYAQGQIAALIATLSPKFAQYLTSLADLQKNMLESFMDYSKDQALSHQLQGYCEAAISGAGALGSGATAYGSFQAVGEFNDAQKALLSENEALDGPTAQMKKLDVEMEEIQPGNKPKDLQDPELVRNPLKDTEKSTIAQNKQAYDAELKKIDMKYQKLASGGNMASQAAQALSNGAKANFTSNADLQNAASSLVNQQASMAGEAYSGTVHVWEGMVGSINRLMAYGEGMIRA